MTKNVFKRKQGKNVKMKYFNWDFLLLLLIQLIHLLWFKFQCLPTVSLRVRLTLLLFFSFYYLIYILFPTCVSLLHVYFFFRSAIVNWVTSKYIKIRERNKFSFLFLIPHLTGISLKVKRLEKSEKKSLYMCFDTFIYFKFHFDFLFSLHVPCTVPWLLSQSI